MPDKSKSVAASATSHDELYSLAVFGVLTLVLVLGYLNSLAEAWVYWKGPQYSHGWLVPVFTAVLLWMRREPIPPVLAKERWWGVGLLAFGLLLRLICAQIGLDIPDMYTFVISMTGLVLLAGGWPMFRWAGPAVGFLIFMFPLPWSVERALLAPLQSLATDVSTYALQTLGVEAYTTGGNRIFIEELKMGVVDQCSGLRMTTIFVALSVAIVLVTKRPWWEHLIILLSAVPIALTVNVTRITVTGILHRTLGKEWADLVFHDLAGYLMVPMALALLWLELVIMSHLFYEVETEVPVTMWGRQASGVGSKGK